MIENIPDYRYISILSPDSLGKRHNRYKEFIETKTCFEQGKSFVAANTETLLMLAHDTIVCDKTDEACTQKLYSLSVTAPGILELLANLYSEVISGLLKGHTFLSQNKYKSPVGKLRRKEIYQSIIDYQYFENFANVEATLSGWHNTVLPYAILRRFLKKKYANISYAPLNENDLLYDVMMASFLLDCHRFYLNFQSKRSKSYKIKGIDEKKFNNKLALLIELSKYIDVHEEQEIVNAKKYIESKERDGNAIIAIRNIFDEFKIAYTENASAGYENLKLISNCLNYIGYDFFPGYDREKIVLQPDYKIIVYKAENKAIDLSLTIKSHKLLFFVLCNFSKNSIESIESYVNDVTENIDEQRYLSKWLLFLENNWKFLNEAQLNKLLKDVGAYGTSQMLTLCIDYFKKNPDQLDVNEFTELMKKCNVTVESIDTAIDDILHRKPEEIDDKDNLPNKEIVKPLQVPITIDNTSVPNYCIYIVTDMLDINKAYLSQRSSCEEFAKKTKGVIVAEAKEKINEEYGHAELYKTIERCKRRKWTLLIAEMGMMLYNKDFRYEVIRNSIDIRFCDCPDINKQSFRAIDSFIQYVEKKEVESEVIVSKRNIQSIFFSTEKDKPIPETDIKVNVYNFKKYIRNNNKHREDHEEKVEQEEKRVKKTIATVSSPKNISEITKLLMTKDYWSIKEIDKIANKMKLSTPDLLCQIDAYAYTIVGFPIFDNIGKSLCMFTDYKDSF